VPGAPLRQDTPNPSAESQQFRFEDAGNGYWYLRARAGSLYLTADATLTVTQQPKYPPDGSGATNPAAQRWKLTPGIMPGTGVTVSNAAFPAKTLQPANNGSGAGVAVVLGEPESGPIGAGHVKNAWVVTSPLLPSGHVSLP
jgi:hypothetical protein